MEGFGGFCREDLRDFARLHACSLTGGRARTGICLTEMPLWGEDKAFGLNGFDTFQKQTSPRCEANGSCRAVIHQFA